MVLSRALSERLAKWGKEYIDPTKATEPKDRQGKSLGVTIYQAFSCEFGCLRPRGPSAASLSLTVVRETIDNGRIFNMVMTVTCWKYDLISLPDCFLSSIIFSHQDLRAKLMRSSSVLDALYDGHGDPTTFQLSRQDKDRAERAWIGETVIYRIDKKCYSVVGFEWGHSADSLPVDGLLIDGKPVSHAKYFAERKKIRLQYPNVKPMVKGKKAFVIYNSEN
jgi:hypothetical protein